MAASTQDLQRLVVTVEAKLDKFTKAMEKMSRDSTKATKSVETNFRRMEGSVKSFGQGLIAGFSFERIGSFIGRSVKQMAELADEAKRAGVNVEDLQAAIFAARQEGGSAEDIVAAFSKLNLELGEAASKGNELGKILEANNLSIKSLQGDPLKAMMAIADLMKNAATAQDAAVIGNAAFGRGFRELLPFLIQGSETIKAQTDRARELGAVISTDLVNSAKEFDDKLTAIGDVTIAQLRISVGGLIRDFEQLFGLMDIAARGTGLSDAGSITSQIDKVLSMSPQELAEWLAGKFGIKQPANQTQQIGSGGMFGEGHGFPPGPVTKLPVSGGKAATIGAGRQAIEQTDDAMDKLIASMDEARAATRGFIGDLVGGLRQGLSLTQALGQAFQNLADKLLDKALDQVVDQLLGPAGTAQSGLLGQALGITMKDQSRLTGGGGAAAAVGDIISGGASSDTLRGGIQTGSIADYITNAARQRGIDPATALKVWAGEGKGAWQSNVMRNGKRETSFGDFQLLKGGGLGDEFEASTGLSVSDPANRFKMIDFALDKAKQGGWGPWYGAKKAGITGFMGIDKGGGAGTPALEQPMVQVKQSLEKVAETAKTAETAIQPIVPAAMSIVQTVLKAATGGAGGGISSLLSLFQSGAMIGGGGFAPVSGGLYGGGRADGGPVAPGMAYTVGERGAETFMPTVPGVIVPHGGGRGNDAMAVSVFESPMFKVIVERIAAQGDVRTLKAARRGYPTTAARFQKLGTV